MSRMARSVDSSQPLSLAITVLEKGLMNKVIMVVGMEVSHGLSNMDRHASGRTYI